MSFRGADKTLRQMVKEFEARGWEVSITGGRHLKWTHISTGQIVFSAQTPSDRRAYLNIRKRLEKVEQGRLLSAF